MRFFKRMCKRYGTGTSAVGAANTLGAGIPVTAAKFGAFLCGKLSAFWSCAFARLRSYRRRSVLPRSF
jgi:hypothetical protein